MPRAFVVALAVPLALHAAQQPQTPAAAAERKTIWQGVYSPAQAARGEEAYKTACGRCHAVDVARATSPTFVGTEFFERWREQSVADLFMTIAVNMPRDRPNSLTPQEYVDIVSFFLKANAVPPGERELPADVDALLEIAVTERPPPK